mmetsp:Transcript_48532/g.49327  ORF Transcript_48532/g.49327 Transcript_48532/m.49327 type:complete len:284 (+) Transcript_48532:42-893(+)
MPQLLRLLRSLPSYRPGIAYVLDRVLYLSPTVHSPAANTMRSCCGPRFASRESGLIPMSSDTITTAESSGFEPLLPVKENDENNDDAQDDNDPTAEELATLVDDFYAALAAAETEKKKEEHSFGSMGEKSGGVVFQGNGDPLAAVGVVVDTVRLVAERRNGIAFRLNTLGLCAPNDLDFLLSSTDIVARRSDDNDSDDQRRETRIATVSVFLPAANPTQYAALLQPKGQFGFSDVCSFVVRLAEAGVNVECTTVARPDIKVAEVEALAMSLGATSFRTRKWIP